MLKKAGFINFLHLFLKKLKLKFIRVLPKAQKVIAGLMLAVFCAFLLPAQVFATQGVADDGRPDGQENRTFGSEDIVLKTVTDVATNLECNGNTLGNITSKLGSLSGQQLSDEADKLCSFDTNLFARMGKQSGKSFLLVRQRLYLESPNSLNFSNESYLKTVLNLGTLGLASLVYSAPKVDYVKVKNGFAGSGWFEVIHPLLGYGFFLGKSDKVTCADKNIAYPWETEESFKFCDLPAGNLSDFFGNWLGTKDGGEAGGNSTIKFDGAFSAQEVAKNKGLIHTYLNYIDAGGRLEKWGLDNTSTVQKVDVWPYLYINIGRRQTKEKLIVSGEAINIIKRTSEVLPGYWNKVTEVYTKVKNGAITAVQAKAEMLGFLSSKGVQGAEAEKYARVAEKMGTRMVETLSTAGRTIKLDQFVADIADVVAREARDAGMAAEQVSLIATDAAKNILANNSKASEVIISLSEKTGEAAAKAAGVTEVAAKSGSRAAKFVRFLKYTGPFAGPIIDGMFLTFTVAEYRNAHLDYYDTNKATIAFQVYDTDVLAQQHKTDPIPAGLNVESGAGSTGAGQTVSSKKGSPLLGFLNELISLIVGAVQELIFLIFTTLIVPLLEAVLAIRTYTDQFAAVIYPGWIVIRNLCNILFIVALIVIAMGTLLRLDGYQFRGMLVQLIIAALLVNFSLFVGQAVLGVADTVQNQFLPNNRAVIRSLGADLMVNNREQFLKLFKGDFSSEGYFSQTVKPIFMLLISAGTFMVFLAIAAFLVVRIVMLWILLMVSPIAYAAGALPSTSHYREEWWSTFLKYAFFTPVMAFCLNMAAVILNAQKTNPILSQISTASFGDNNLSSFVFHVASNILLLIFLLVALQAAEKFSIIGADKITKIAKGGMFAPLLPLKLGGGYVARKWNEKTEHLLEQHGENKPGIGRKLLFAALNPVAVVKGYQKRSEELAHIAKEGAEAGGREVWEQFITGGKLQIPYRQFTARKDENNFLKDYENMKKESLMAAAVAAEKIGGAEGQIRRRSITKAAAKNGYLDDLMRMKHFAIKYADKDGTLTSEEVLNRFFYGYLGDNEQTSRFLAEDMEDLGRNTNHWEYMGHSYYDNKEKRWKRGMKVLGKETVKRNGQTVQIDILKNDWQADYEVGEFAKVDGRTRNKVAPHVVKSYRAITDDDGNLVEYDKDGNLVEVGDEITQIRRGKKDGTKTVAQEAVLRVLNQADTARDASFAQARMKDQFLSYEIDPLTGDIIVPDEDVANAVAMDFRTANLYSRVLYSAKTGIDHNQVQKFRMAWFDKNGNKKTKTVGDPNSTLPNVVDRNIVSNIIQKPELEKLDGKEKESIKNTISEFIRNSSLGAANDNDLEAAIISDVAPKVQKILKPGVIFNVDKFKNDLYSEMRETTFSNFRPLSLLEGLRDKYVLTVTEVNKIDDAVSNAVADAKVIATKQGINLTSNPVVLENQISTNLNNALQAINQTRASQKQESVNLSAVDYKKFVEYAKG